jgi:diguanylate cyclase (GGDEF)-like protein
MQPFAAAPLLALHEHRYRHQIRNVYVVAAVSTLLLVASFSLLGLRPLIEYLRETHAESIELALQNSAGRLQMILNHHPALAQQAASRTIIRLEQAAYVRGEITQQALVEFSGPKLADAISTNPSLLGIARYAPDGRRLYAVGQPVPEAMAAHCDATSLAAVSLLAHAARYQRPLTLLLLDIDHFKQLNDQCGNRGGDAVLAQLATLCTGLIRDSDRLARYGGEEFLLILPETSVEEGARLAERLRARVAQHRFQVGDQDRQITVSVGLVGWDGTGTDTVPTKAELLRCADRALYRSKALGRDRVTSAGTLRADAVCPIA